ncbi:MAG: hypothetical protein ABI769_10840 [Pseudomonadota bacterium]
MNGAGVAKYCGANRGVGKQSGNHNANARIDRQIHRQRCPRVGTPAANASDHLDTAAVIADPSGDIGDLYAWSHDGRLNLVMTIVGGKFSDHVRYSFHIDSGKSVGKTDATIDFECDFESAFAPQCRLGDVERARGDAGSPSGLMSEQGRFRVFAGVRDDPFYDNVRGTRAALNVAGAVLTAGVARDGAGCPRFTRATVARILDEWQHSDGHAGANLLAGWKIAALVISVDLKAVNHGGPLLGVWGTTSVRAAPPNHPPRTGWADFEADIAATLAIYDAFDGVCGNQWLAVQNATPATRYSELAQLLADDRLWVNSTAKSCHQYLAAEYHHAGAANHDCGGRTPNYDAVDVFHSLLVRGHTSGVSDGVDADDRVHSDTQFPFLASPPTPPL